MRTVVVLRVRASTALAQAIRTLVKVHIKCAKGQELSDGLDERVRDEAQLGNRPPTEAGGLLPGTGASASPSVCTQASATATFPRQVARRSCCPDGHTQAPHQQTPGREPCTVLSRMSRMRSSSSLSFIAPLPYGRW